MAGKKPRVAVIGTGGSISIPGNHNLDLYEYGDHNPPMEVDELLDRIPEARTGSGCEVVPIRFRALPSTAVNPDDWLELNRRIHELVAGDPGLAGIAITHGTATLEETAYFLHLSLKVDMPVVLVGAQRPPNGLSTDAALNLLNAIRVAGSPETRGLGVLTMLNQEIQSARDVTKTANFRLQTFRSQDFGVLGYAEPDGSVNIYRRPVRRHAPDTEFDLRAVTALPRVDIVYAYAGADGALIEAAVAAGCKGLVYAGLAPGMPPPAAKDALLAAMAAGIPVFLGSRAGSGRVLTRSRSLAEGFVGTDTLNPQKARVLAMLGLTVTRNGDELRRIFATY